MKRRKPVIHDQQDPQQGQFGPRQLGSLLLRQPSISLDDPTQHGHSKHHSAIQLEGLRAAAFLVQSTWRI